MIKLAAQVLLGRKRAHYHAWLPSLRIVSREAGQPGSVTYRGRKAVDLIGQDAIQARAGSHILIIGSGPSVRELLPDTVARRSALLLNGAIDLIGRGLPEPLAVAIEDERFVWRHFEMIAHHVGPDVPMLLSPGAMRAICDHDAGFLVGRPVVLIDDVRKPYGHPRRDDAELAGSADFVLGAGAGFSREPDKGVFQGGSVVVSALQFALATGALEIGFIGVDIANADQARFYESKDHVAFSGVAGAEKRILDHIALARDVASARGVELVNHSPVSALRSIGLDYRPLGTSAA